MTVERLSVGNVNNIQDDSHGDEQNDAHEHGEVPLVPHRPPLLVFYVRTRTNRKMQ